MFHISVKRSRLPNPVIRAAANVAAIFTTLFVLLGASSNAHANPSGVIKHVNTGSCFDGNGTSVYIATQNCNAGNPYQQWKRYGANLVHTQSKKCLTSNGITVASLVTCSETDTSQQWIAEGPLFRHRASDKCLDSNGQSLYLGPCGSTNVWQKWDHQVPAEAVFALQQDWAYGIAETSKVVMVFNPLNTNVYVKQLGSSCGNGGTVILAYFGSVLKLACKDDGFVGSISIFGQPFMMTALTTAALSANTVGNTKYSFKNGFGSVAVKSASELVTFCTVYRALCNEFIAFEMNAINANITANQTVWGSSCPEPFATPDVTTANRRLQSLVDKPQALRFLIGTTGMMLAATVAYGNVFEEGRIWSSDVATRNEAWRKSAKGGAYGLGMMAISPLYHAFIKDNELKARLLEMGIHGYVAFMTFIKNQSLQTYNMYINNIPGFCGTSSDVLVPDGSNTPGLMGDQTGDDGFDELL